MTQPWEIGGFLSESGNELFIDGVSAPALAREYGTPLFVFSERRIARNVGYLRSARWPSGPPLKVCYASKANSNLSILKAVLEAGADVEVNSGGELFKALHVGFLPSQIIFNGTSKDEREIREAVDAGIYSIQADSISELELIEKVARQKGGRADVSLRLVPEITTNTLQGLQTALVTSKFGMMPDEGVRAYARWGDGTGAVRLRGIHIHIGSQNPDRSSYVEAFRVLYRESKRIFDATGFKPGHFNIGGGFPVNYLRGEPHAPQMADEQRDLFASSFDVPEAIRKAWETASASAAEEGYGHLFEDLELVTEPGRIVVADAGVCLTTVRHAKERPIQRDGGVSGIDRWLLTDAGFNILLSMATYKWYYHIIAASRAREPHSTGYRIAGPLCDGGDVYFDIEGRERLPDHRLLPDGIRAGDVLALLNCGAYSIAQMFPYNGRTLPAVILIGKDGVPRIARTRDTYQDLLTNETGS